MQAQVAHLWCPEPDSNRHGRLRPRDFKSLVSTTFTIRATRTTTHPAGRCARERVPRKLTVLAQLLPTRAGHVGPRLEITAGR
jgi:hypothetical protein